jgi:hypothetical protein
MSNKRCKNEEYGRPVVSDELTPEQENQQVALFNHLVTLARYHQLCLSKPVVHTDIYAMD